MKNTHEKYRVSILIYKSKRTDFLDLLHLAKLKYLFSWTNI